MKRILAAILLFACIASPSFAAKHSRQHHKKANYSYKAPKSYKPHFHKQKQHHHRSA